VHDRKSVIGIITVASVYTTLLLQRAKPSEVLRLVSRSWEEGFETLGNPL
jgi:hypothetical protein